MVTYEIDLSSKKAPNLVVHLTPGSSTIRLAKIVCDWFDEPLAKLIDPRDACVRELTTTIRKLLKDDLNMEAKELIKFHKHASSHRMMSVIMAQIIEVNWKTFYEYEAWKIFHYLASVLMGCTVINDSPAERDELIQEKLQNDLLELVCLKCFLIQVQKYPEKFAWDKDRLKDMPDEDTLLALCESTGDISMIAADLVKDLRYRLTQ